MELKNLYAYIKERFPFINMALFAILFLTVLSVAHHSNGQILSLGWRESIGVVAVISFFFRLRVFDEIKDYQIDSINHPNRVLQSGKIHIRHLIWISAGVGLSEIAWSLMMGKYVLLFWLLCFGYAVLMRYEFFVSTFLKKRLLIYAFTHMLIMPLIIVWIWSAYAPVQGHFNLFLLALLSVLSGFSFEVARKIHSPNSEKPTVDSYSKSIGFKPSILLVIIILLLGIIVQFLFLQRIESRSWPFYLIALLYGVIIISYVKAIVGDNEKKLRNSEVLVSLFMLLSYLSVIIEINF
jgi:4-hydroxybenzoate polyprenyltransferase